LCAGERLAPLTEKGFLGRRFCYTQRFRPQISTGNETRRNLHVLSRGKFRRRTPWELEIQADPALESFAEAILPEGRIICHLATGQPKKEWPLAHWAELFQKASARGLKLIFSTGQGSREQSLLEEFRKLAANTPCATGAPGPGRISGGVETGRNYSSLATPGRFILRRDWGCLPLACSAPPSVTLWGPLGPQPNPARQLLPLRVAIPGVCLAPQHCMAAISIDEFLNRIERFPQIRQKRMDLAELAYTAIICESAVRKFYGYSQD